MAQLIVFIVLLELAILARVYMNTAPVWEDTVDILSKRVQVFPRCLSDGFIFICETPEGLHGFEENITGSMEIGEISILDVLSLKKRYTERKL